MGHSFLKPLTSYSRGVEAVKRYTPLCDVSLISSCSLLRKGIRLPSFVPSLNLFLSRFLVTLCSNRMCLSFFVQYESSDEFMADITLLFSNAQTFNEPGSQIYRDSSTLEAVVRATLASIPDTPLFNPIHLKAKYG